MSRLPRLLAPLSVAAAFAVAAPAAQAGTTATFPAVGPLTTTVTITDPGPAFDTVHLTVTAADPAKLADTWVYLGGDDAVVRDRPRRRSRSPLRRRLADSLRRRVRSTAARASTTSQVTPERGQLHRRAAEGRAHLLRGHRGRRRNRRRRPPVRRLRLRRPGDRLCQHQRGDRRLLVGRARGSGDHRGRRWAPPGRAQLRPGPGHRVRHLPCRRRGQDSVSRRTCAGTATTCRSSSPRIPTGPALEPGTQLLVPRCAPLACSTPIARRTTSWSARSAR